ncbi:MAG: nucleotide sugar dehydrogenase [Balneolales bacterium]
MKEQILQNIEDRNYTVGIVGLGYVGLPLLWTFHEKGYKVVGFDVDQSKIDAINHGKTYIKHFTDDKLQKLADSGRCALSTNFSDAGGVDAVMMCVPTPLNKYREPDMSYVEATTRSIAPFIKKGQLIVLESTTYPGTTEELIKPICEELSGLKSGEDFYLGYSPEREDPGNPSFVTATIPKVVGGDGADALAVSIALYSSVINQAVPVSDTKTAEAVKLLENIFRSVNIALVNELKVVFEEMDIDIYEVINAAKTKPFGYMPFYPGPGLGGHCIPIDPFYLTWKAREYGLNTRFIELAGEVNTDMPKYVLKRTMEALNCQGKAVSRSKVLCVGLAYKPDVDDMRESPTYHIMDLLDKYGAQVDYHDDYVPVIPPTREHAHWAGYKSVPFDQQTFSQYDAVIITTNHSYLDIQKLYDWSKCIIDTRNALEYLGTTDNHKVWKA